MRLLVAACTLLALGSCASVPGIDFQAIVDTVNSSPAKWRAGHNFDPSTLPTYIRSLLGSKRPSAQRLPVGELLEDKEIPEEFDARTQWPLCTTIGQVAEEGPCHSSWAIVAASAFSDRYCIATNGTFNLPLSAQEILSCCINCGFGCGGGYQIQAWKYFNEYGVVTGGLYNSSIGCQPYQLQGNHSVQPYLNLPDPDTPLCQKNCTNPSYNVSFAEDHRKAKTVYSLYQNVTQIQLDILLYGPVETTFDVYADFTTYKTGVYQHVTGEILGAHNVKVLGWGAENGTAYWLCSNSWGESWGDKGFFKILRGQDESYFEDHMVAGIPDV